MHPYINYIPVHVTLTLVFYLFPDFLNPKLFDTVLFPLDALVRAGAVTGAITHLSISTPSSSNSIHPALVMSPLTHMIIGGLASSGGGITAATLSTWSPSWSFSTPPLFRAGTGLWGSVDFWGGGLAAAIYGIATGHEAFSYATAALRGLGLMSMKTDSWEAKALASVVLTILFGIRAWKVHWAAGGAPSSGNGAKSKAQ